MQKKKIKLLSIIVIVAFVVLLVGGVSYGRYYASQKKEDKKIEKEQEAQADKENAKAAEKNAEQDVIEEPAILENDQIAAEPTDTDFVNEDNHSDGVDEHTPFRKIGKGSRDKGQDNGTRITDYIQILWWILSMPQAIILREQLSTILRMPICAMEQ